MVKLYPIMRQKVLGIGLLIFGIYLVLNNPIVSVLIHVVFNLRIDIPLSPFIFWLDALKVHWLWITILIIGLGVIFIKYGCRYMLNVQA